MSDKSVRDLAKPAAEGTVCDVPGCGRPAAVVYDRVFVCETHNPPPNDAGSGSWLDSVDCQNLRQGKSEGFSDVVAKKFHQDLAKRGV
jgi:hypothetical protein